MVLESFSVEAAEPVAELPRMTNRRQTAMQVLHRKSTMLACAAALAEAKDEIQDRNAESEEHHGPITGLSVSDSVSTLLLGVAGAAGALFPFAMKTSGYMIAPIILVVISVMMVETSCLVSSGMSKLEQASKSTPGSLKNYESFGHAVGGGLGYAIVMLTKGIGLCGACLIRIQFQTDSICALFRTEQTDYVRFMLVMPLFIGFGCVKDIARLARFSIFGLAGLGLLYFCIMIGGLVAAWSTDRCEGDVYVEGSDCRFYSPVPDDGLALQDIAMVSSLCLLNTAHVAVAASVRPKMSQPSQIIRSSRLAIGLVCTVYFLLMALGYYGFGEGVGEKVIVDIARHSPFLGSIAAIGMIVNCTISAPISFLIVVDTLESMGTSTFHTPLSPLNMIWRAGLIVALTLVSWCVPYVAEVIGMLSSVITVSNNVFLPVLLHYYLRRSGRVQNDQQSTLKHTFHVGIMITGVGVGIFGFRGSYNKLMMKLSADAAKKNAGLQGLSTSTVQLLQSYFA